MQDQNKQDTQAINSDGEKPQWQQPVLIPLDLADAQAGVVPSGRPDGAGCS